MESHKMKRKFVTICSVTLLGAAFLIWLFLPSSDVGSAVKSHSLDTDRGATQPQISNHSPAFEQQSRIEPSQTIPSISDGALNDMKHAAEITAPSFDNVPDDQTGRRSRWFEQLKLWHQLIEKAGETGGREDLFALVPVTASFFARDRETEPLVDPLDDLRHWMEHPGPHIIRELGKVVAENDGTLDAATAALAVQVFSVRGFDNESDWEDERKPIDSAGILIARPEIMPLLEALPIDQLSFFLRAQTPEMFFRRYDSKGDGMPVLRDRFSANRDQLRLNFVTLANRVEAQQSN